MTDMQPAEYDIVTIQNVDVNEFTFEFNKSQGTRPYTIKAGEIARYPRFLADHAVSKLIDQILTRKKIRTNDKMMRLKYAQKIVLSEEIILPETKATEGEILNKKVDELNKVSELENILGKKRLAAKPEENFILKEDKTLEDEETPKVPLKPTPTRSVLMKYAVENLGMTLDAKSKAIYDKMSIPELAKNLDYHEEA